MNKTGCVSIIVPVYNAEKYIRQCLDSVLAQTLTAWEAILVDDGSTDRSGQICDEYATRDSRFRVIHQPNGGVSIARQTGIDNATGEYTIHCDPDDWMESTMLEEMVGTAEATESDMVICDYYTDSRYDRTYCSQNLPLRPDTEDVLRRLLFQQLHGSCWNKLVKRVCYKGIGFYPSHICVFEDELFFCRLLTRNIKTKIAYLPKTLYHYRIDNDASICHIVSMKSIKSAVDVLEEKQKLVVGDTRFSNEDFYSNKKNILWMTILGKCFNICLTMYPEIQARVIMEGIPYKIKTPVSSCLSIALRGYPRIAYRLYIINIQLINIVKRVKRWLCLKSSSSIPPNNINAARQK